MLLHHTRYAYITPLLGPMLPYFLKVVSNNQRNAFVSELRQRLSTAEARTLWPLCCKVLCTGRWCDQKNA